MKARIAVAILLIGLIGLGFFEFRPETSSQLIVPTTIAMPVNPQVKPEDDSNHIGQSANPSARSEQPVPEQVTPSGFEESQLMNPIDRIKAIQEKTDLHQAIIQDHERHIRYPEYNTRFEQAERDPTQRRYEIDERTTTSGDRKYSLTLWADKKYYLYGDEVTIRAQLRDETGLPIPTRFAGQLIYDERNNLRLYDMGSVDQDGMATLQFTLINEDNIRYQPGVYKFLVVNQHNELSDAVTFVLSEPQAELTGNYRDKLTEDGSLLIEAELNVSQKNRYYLEATLYSSTNDPIGHSQYSGPLEPGKHWIPLNFYGLMFHDTAEPGPYLLRNLSLAKVVMPMQRGPIVNPEYYTAAYTVDQFSREPHTP